MNIAIISYFFNDHHAEGIVTAKLARALTEAGHSVTVFGCLIGEQKIINKNLSNLDCLRVNSKSPRWWEFLENVLPSNTLGQKVSAIPRLITYSNPNDYGWIINVKKAFIDIHKKRPFDIIHSRLNPHSSHQAAQMIKKTYPNIPWCAYFSDPWPPHRILDPYQSSEGTLSKWRANRLMKSFLMDSDSTIFTCTNMRDFLLKNANPKIFDNSFVAPHLSSFWESPSKHIKKDILTFRHAGILNKYRRPNILFDGIRQFLKKNKGATNRIRFEFLGRNYAGPNSEAIKPPHDLKQIIRFHDQKDLKSTWEWMAKADVLLLLEFRFSKGIFFYAKLSDYLHTSRPILALSPQNGVVADLFKDGGGKIVAPDNADHIGDTIHEIFSIWESENLTKITQNNSLAEMVHPKKIIPAYEEAFEKAIMNNS